MAKYCSLKKQSSRMADRLTIILNFKSHDGTESEVQQTYLTVAGKGNHLEKS